MFHTNQGYVVAAVDGSLGRDDESHTPCGFSAFFSDSIFTSGHLPLELSADITTAELAAILLCLQQAQKYNIKHLRILSDSEKSVDLYKKLNLLHSMCYTDVRQPHYVPILREIHQEKRKFIRAEVIKIKAHQKIDAICRKLNEGANKLAVKARIQATRALKNIN